MIEEDAALAADLAEAAGRLLIELRADPALSGKALGEAGDRKANALILDALARERPGDAVLSEECRDTPERLHHRRVWIVDPLDGTREYGENRADFAVHVGLAIDGVATHGAVALPALDLVLRSDRPGELSALGESARLLVSRSRPPQEAARVAEELGAEIVEMGSAGAKAMAVVRGEAEIYLHSGGQFEWDNCAPVAVARAHGLHVSRLDGSPLRYNQREPFVPDLLICRKEWAPRVLRAVREAKKARDA